MVGFLEREKVRDRRAGRTQLAGGLLEFGGVGFILAFSGFDANQLTETRQGAAHLSTFGKACFADAELPSFFKGALFADLLKKALSHRQDIAHCTARGAIFEHLKETFFAAGIVEALNDAAQAELRHLHADVARSDLLHRVSLIENHKVIRKKKPAGAVLCVFHTIQQREKQGVVEDNHFRIRHAAAQVLIKTSASRGACLRCAQMLLAAHLLPHGGIRLLQKIAQRPILRLHAPLADALQLGMLRRGEQFLRLRQRAGQTRGAEVILPPFEQYRLELFGDDFLHERNVLEHELFLERDRVGADHGLALRPHSVQRCRHQVGEGFSNARARLNHEMPARLNRSSYRSCHALLLRAIFKRCRTRENAGLRENLLHLALKRRGRANLKILPDRNHRDILETREKQSRPPRQTGGLSKGYFPTERVVIAGGGRSSGRPIGSTGSSSSSCCRSGWPSAFMRRAVTKTMRFFLIF